MHPHYQDMLNLQQKAIRITFGIPTFASHNFLCWLRNTKKPREPDFGHYCETPFLKALDSLCLVYWCKGVTAIVTTTMRTTPFYHPTSSTYSLIVFSNTKTKPHNSTWAWICKVVGAATWSTLVTPMTCTREPWLISLSQMTQTVPLEIWIPWSRSMDLVKVPCWDSCFLFVKWSYGFKLVNVMIDI